MDDSMDNKAEVLDCLIEGKRHFLCEDSPPAVSSKVDSCKFMASECGEKAPECGEAHNFYGEALLELARLENLVLGNALSGGNWTCNFGRILVSIFVSSSFSLVLIW